MKKPAILFLLVMAGLFLSSCTHTEEATPQPSSTATIPTPSLVIMGSEAWDPMTKHCDRIGRGCKEDVILCLTPDFPAALFAVLDAGQPGPIKDFFTSPANADCLPAQLVADPEFMALVNDGQIYSRFYTEAINPKRRVYLFGDHPNLTLADNLLIAPINYQ